MLVAMLRRRSDCQELPTGPVLAANGLPAVLSGGRSRPYVRDVAPRTDAWPGWQTLGATCDEGFSLDVQPLISQDGTAVEAVMRCRIDQVERMAPVVVNVPVANQQRNLMLTALLVAPQRVIAAGQARAFVALDLANRTLQSAYPGMQTAVAELLPLSDGSLLCLGEAGATVLPPAVHP